MGYEEVTKHSNTRHVVTDYIDGTGVTTDAKSLQIPVEIDEYTCLPTH